jgi:hypothetical protein
MKPKVTSKELSQKLKEAGLPQEGLFFSDPRTDRIQYGFGHYMDREGRMKWFLYRPTATEGLERLPSAIVKGWKYEEPTLHIKHWHKYEDVWEVYYEGKNGHCGSCAEIEKICSIEDKNLANAVAKMWLYLNERNLLSK